MSVNGVVIRMNVGPPASVRATEWVGRMLVDLRSHLAAIVAALPEDGSVTLTVATLRGWVAESGGAPADGVQIDFTVEQVAEKLNCSPSTVRTWLCQRRLPGAYRLRGRELRIPPATLQAFLREEAQGVTEPRSRRPAGEVRRLDDWRRVIGPG